MISKSRSKFVDIQIDKDIRYSVYDDFSNRIHNKVEVLLLNQVMNQIRDQIKDPVSFQLLDKINAYE